MVCCRFTQEFFLINKKNACLHFAPGSITCTQVFSTSLHKKSKHFLELITVLKMVKTAIAGGSGGLGKAIAAAILAKQTHEYIVLSSRPTSDDNTFVVS